MQKIMYLASNAGSIPAERITSTARKGLKWFQQTHVGDVLEMVETESGNRIGFAAVVLKETLPYSEVIANADHNHVGAGRSIAQAKERLAVELEAAYGYNKSYETFTVLHLLPLPHLPEAFERLVKAAQGVADTAKHCIAEAVGEAIKSTARARNAEYAASLLMDTVQQMQDATAQRVQAIGEDITGIITGMTIAEEADGAAPSAVERSHTMGDLTITTRVEFD